MLVAVTVCHCSPFLISNNDGGNADAHRRSRRGRFPARQGTLREDQLGLEVCNGKPFLVTNQETNSEPTPTRNGGPDPKGDRGQCDPEPHPKAKPRGPRTAYQDTLSKASTALRRRPSSMRRTALRRQAKAHQRKPAASARRTAPRQSDGPLQPRKCLASKPQCDSPPQPPQLNGTATASTGDDCGSLVILGFLLAGSGLRHTCALPVPGPTVAPLTLMQTCRENLLC